MLPDGQGLESFTIRCRDREVESGTEEIDIRGTSGQGRATGSHNITAMEGFSLNSVGEKREIFCTFMDPSHSANDLLVNVYEQFIRF